MNRFLHSKAQSAVEYLTITAIALMMILPATIIFLEYSRSANDEVVSNQLNLAGNTILQKSEEMFIIGRDSWITIEVGLPSSISASGINGNSEMFMTYATNQGDSQAVFFFQRFNVTNGPSSCAQTCSLGLTPGINKIKIESLGTSVRLTRIG